MWKMIAVPMVGAVIGYITNWIAVKMLFRPRYEKKIGNWVVPFTPGIIPKGQPRLARAIGRAVETQLLTPQVMRDMLLSEEKKEEILQKVTSWIEERKASEATIKDRALTYMDEESLKELKLFAAEEGSQYLMNKIMEANPGRKLTTKIVEAANEKLADTMFGVMLGGSFLDGIAASAEEKINTYLEENGYTYIERKISEELDSYVDKPEGQIYSFFEKNEIEIPSILLGIYEKVLGESMEEIVESLHLSKVVEDRINAMKVEEVEELVLSIMKKELSAVVNLGAVIGFVLGLVNVAILYI